VGFGSVGWECREGVGEEIGSYGPEENGGRGFATNTTKDGDADPTCRNSSSKWWSVAAVRAAGSGGQAGMRRSWTGKEMIREKHVCAAAAAATQQQQMAANQDAAVNFAELGSVWRVGWDGVRKQQVQQQQQQQRGVGEG
jgi:hypothetical protein